MTLRTLYTRKQRYITLPEKPHFFVSIITNIIISICISIRIKNTLAFGRLNQDQRQLTFPAYKKWI